MARRAWIVVLCGFSLVACGHDSSLPSACTRGPGAVRAALRGAPRPVRVGGVPLSRCVADANDPGELQATGVGLVGAAADLAAAARRKPGGQAELRLGYLLGAARRGTGSALGQRSELIRRLWQEARTLGGRRVAFRRGLDAGRRSG